MKVKSKDQKQKHEDKQSARRTLSAQVQANRKAKKALIVRPATISRGFVSYENKPDHSNKFTELGKAQVEALSGDAKTAYLLTKADYDRNNQKKSVIALARHPKSIRAERREMQRAIAKAQKITEKTTKAA
jgi:hypothetical protein